MPTLYEIEIRGLLSARHARAFDGFHVVPGPAGSVLRGPVRDQAHLHAVLDRLRQLGLDLMSVRAHEDGDRRPARGDATPKEPCMSSVAPALDSDRIEQFAGRVVADQAAVFTGVLTWLGDRLGLYRSLADNGPQTIAALAATTGCAARYVQEWAAAQTAAGYLTYDPATTQFILSPEHAAVLAVDESPANLVGGFAATKAAWAASDRLAEAFRTGEGIPWGDHHDCLFAGTERFYAAGYRANLVESWIPALGDVAERLRTGGRVLDVGCGHGAPTILMAQAFPEARFVGVDAHAPSIEVARVRAVEAGVDDRVTFDVATATSYGQRGFDLVCFFDVLHDLGDPIAAAAHAAGALTPGGAVMLVEPRAGDRLEDNLTPVGQVFYAASTCLCTPNALAQDGGLALGAQAGPERLRAVLAAGGLTDVRVAAETPVNLVLDARA